MVCVGDDVLVVVVEVFGGVVDCCDVVFVESDWIEFIDFFEFNF